MLERRLTLRHPCYNLCIGGEGLHHRAQAMTTTQRKQAIRHDIMNVIRANNLEVTGEFWFMLIFRTESELKEIARGLHVRVA